MFKSSFEKVPGLNFHTCFMLVVSESLPEHGHCWFDINDSRISCIHEKDLQSQFAGKESAYMLFYRRKNLSACVEDPGKTNKAICCSCLFVVVVVVVVVVDL